MSAKQGFTLLGINRMEMPRYDPLQDVHLKRHWRSTTKRDPMVRKLYKNTIISTKKKRELEKKE